MVMKRAFNINDIIRDYPLNKGYDWIVLLGEPAVKRNNYLGSRYADTYAAWLTYMDDDDPECRGWAVYDSRVDGNIAYKLSLDEAARMVQTMVNLGAFDG